MTLPSEEYRLIPLTRGQFAKVNTEHFDWLTQWKWTAIWSECTKSFYAARASKKRSIKMHRFIMGVEDSSIWVDHIDGDTLNNLRSNLRIATRSQNTANSRLRASSKSGFKGVSWKKARSKWVAQITHQQKVTYLGLFNTAEEAHAAYYEAAKRLHGEFARER